MNILRKYASRAGIVCIVTVSFLFLQSSLYSAEERILTKATVNNVSLKNEVQHAIGKGLTWLRQQQNPNGFWGQPEYPALSGLALTAFMGDPSGNYKKKAQPFIKNGYDYLIKCAKPDGGIYVTDLSSYNTAISVMALQVAGNASYNPVILNGRNFLVGLQGDFGEKGKIDTPFDGGVGYGNKYDHSDLSNTVLALEAIYYTKYLQQDASAGKSEFKDLNWEAARKFIERCQNLPGYNDQKWASGDPQNLGGFVYFPGDSKAGEEKSPSGEIALRSYGSISYAGLLSYIYADMEKDDPRVKAVYKWLKKNYTLEENPGMGAQGLYYYYHTMAKALSLYGVDEIELENGKKVNWRKDLALKLINLQKAEGFWANENNRWWEKDPVLATSYTLIALEILYRGL